MKQDVITSADAFGRRPIGLVLQDLQWAEKLFEEDLHLQELGIAALSSLTLNINRDPKTPPTKSSDFHHFMRSGSTTFSSIACDTFASLSKDGLLPSLFYDVIQPELLQKLIDGKKGLRVSATRALVADDILIIAPRILNGFVTSPVGCLGALESGWYSVRDIDTDDRYEVEILLEAEAIGMAHTFDECSWLIRRVDSLILLS